MQIVFEGNNSTWNLETIILYIIPADLGRLTELENCHIVNPNEIIDSGKKTSMIDKMLMEDLALK